MTAWNPGRSLTRREFNRLSAASLAAPLAIGGSGEPPADVPAIGPEVIRKQGSGPRRGFNILFVFGDQERYFPKLPPGLALPGRERLQQTGVTFQNHYTSAIMCTSSRSVLVTGLQTPDNRMFENTDVA